MAVIDGWCYGCEQVGFSFTIDEIGSLPSTLKLKWELYNFAEGTKSLNGFIRPSLFAACFGRYSELFAV
jgi:hypothetical protein